jgi:uncharacterized protein
MEPLVSERNLVRLVVGGEYHDFDFVRLELLKLLAEFDTVRTTCSADFCGLDALAADDFLLTYTSNVIPCAAELAGLSSFIKSGGRWLAIHGSAALTRFKPPAVDIGGIRLPGLTDTPDLAPDFMDLVGCRFVSHLAQQAFTVTRTGRVHPVVADIYPFEIMDESYILQLRGQCEVLLESRYTGAAPGYVAGPWLADVARPQLVLHRRGMGQVLYFAPGHACGRFDLRPFIDDVPVQRGPWTSAAYRAVIRNAIQWGIGRDP